MEGVREKRIRGRCSVYWDRNQSLGDQWGGDWSTEWIKKNQSEFEIVFEALK